MFSRLSYSRKFILIGLIFVVPLLAFAPLVLAQLQRIDNYGAKELYGALYLRPLQALLRDIHRHEHLMDDYLAGRATQAELQALQAQIDADFAAAAAEHARYAATLRLSGGPDAVRSQWATLRAKLPDATRASNHADHSRLADSVRYLIARVGDASFLILDPDLDTYYMMDAVLLRAPEIQGLTAQLIILARRVIEQNLAMQSAERAELLIVTSRLRDTLDGLDVGLDIALRHNASGKMKPLTLPAYTAHFQAYQELLALVQARLLTSADVSWTRAEFDALAERSWQAQTDFYAAVSGALELGLRDRISLLTYQLLYPGVVALGVILLAFWIGLSLMRSISRPVSELVRAAGQLEAGQLHTRVAVTTADEVGLLGQAFNRMAESVQSGQQRLAASAEVSRRLSTVLDPRQLVTEVVEQIKAAFGYYHAHIYLFDETRQNLVLAGGTGEVGQTLLRRGHTLPAGRGLVGRAAATGEAGLVPDTAQDPGWLPNALLPETRSEVAVPIIAAGQVVGVLDVQQNVAAGLGVADAELLQSIANQVGIALQNARAYEQAQRRARRETLINAISQRLQSATSVEDVLEIAARELSQALEARRALALLGFRANGHDRAAPPGEPHSLT